MISSSFTFLVSKTLLMDLLAVPIMHRTCLFLPAPFSFLVLYGCYHLNCAPQAYLFNLSQMPCSSTLSECTPPRPSNPVCEIEFFNCFPRISVYNDTERTPCFLGPCRMMDYCCATASSIFRNP